MKILFIIPYFYPSLCFGGPVTASLSLAEEMVKRGHNVTVLTTDLAFRGERLQMKEDEVNGVKIIYAKTFLPKFSYSTRLFLSIEQVIKSFSLIPKYDMIHFHDFFIPQFLPIAIICKFLKKPFLVTPHGTFDFNPQRKKVALKKIFFFLFARFVVDHSRLVIAVSKQEADVVSRNTKYKKQVLFIPNIVHETKHVRTINIKKRYHLPENSKIVLFLGKVDAPKGVRELLLGFNNFVTRGSKGSKETYLLYAGPDMYMIQELSATAKRLKIDEKVLFVGVVDGDLKAALLQQSDVLCLPSYAEALPQVVLEAASNKIPSIFTKECNVVSLADQGGGLLTGREPVEIASVLDKVMNSDQKRQMMGNIAYKWYKDNYSPEKIGKVYEKTYNQLG